MVPPIDPSEMCLPLAFVFDRCYVTDNHVDLSEKQLSLSVARKWWKFGYGSNNDDESAVHILSIKWRTKK